MDLREALVAYRKSVWFRITYLAITAFLVASLFSFGATVAVAACLVILLIPIVMFLVPYYFGERNLRPLIVNGFVIFVIATLMVSALEAQSAVAQPPGPVGGGGPGFTFSEGLVTPYRGAGGAVYNFTVNVTSAANASPESFEVWANITSVDGTAISSAPTIRLDALDLVDNDTADGKAYYGETPLRESIYFYGFAVHDLDSGNYTLSDFGLGPINTGYGSFFMFSLYFLIFPMIVPIALYFLILMLYWWTRRARELRGAPTGTPEAGPTGFTCTNCGADVPEDASTCPSCGAVFEEEPSAPVGGDEGEAEAPGEGGDESR